MDPRVKDSNTFRKSVMKWPYLLLIGFIAGILGLAAFRFMTIKSDKVHYHANFELYINGHRDEFKSFTFYEEEQACTSDPDNPKGLVHMHDENSSLIHIHAHGVTWSQFFANLGYTLGDKVVMTDKGTYIDGQDGNKLVFLLNGKEVSNIADRVIKSEDVLLINYGNDDQATLKQRYEGIPRDAHKENTEKDPASCSGCAELTTKERLRQAFGF